MPNPPPSAERFAGLIFWLSQAVVSRSLIGLLGNPQANLIIDRLRGIKEIFARLAARIAAGRYALRRCGPRRPTEQA